MTDHDFKTGQLAYDVASQSLVEITNDDMGTVADQKDAMQDLIFDSRDNRACGVDEETECIEVRYVGVTDGNREYTMPVSRIWRSDALMEAIQFITQKAGVGRHVHEEFSPTDIEANSRLVDFQDDE